MKPTAWYCPVCNKFDLVDVKEAMASPEHVPHRGYDIGSCKGIMIPLYDCNNCPLKSANKCVESDA